MFAVPSPLPQFFDTDGAPLNGGYVYIGTANLNPETNPISVWWDAAGTQPVAQPIRTLNGYVSRNGNPATVYVASDFSLTVNDKRGQLVLYVPSQPFLAGISPYMLNTMLPAASAAAARTALGSTTVGNAVFTAASPAAARSSLYSDAVNFSAYMSAATLALGNNVDTTITCNTVIENVGSAYNSGTYTFTAPVAGLYLFSYGIRCSVAAFTGINTSNSRLIKNGSALNLNGTGAIQSNLSSPSEFTLSATVPVTLAQGDTMKLVAYKTGSNNTVNAVGATGDFTWFNGTLLR